jgi:hypothetical protein
MLPYGDVFPLRVMLWAVTHQLESLSSVWCDIMSTNLNLIAQASIVYYSSSNEKMEFMSDFPAWHIIFSQEINTKIILSDIVKVCDVNTVNIYVSDHGAPHTSPL